MSVKINQPVTLDLTVSSTIIITSATSYYMTYLTPSYSTGTWSTCSLSTASVLSYEIQKDILSEAGYWHVTGWIVLSTSLTYPTATYEMQVIKEFD
jgi:hypothetical protein